MVPLDLISAHLDELLYMIMSFVDDDEDDLDEDDLDDEERYVYVLVVVGVPVVVFFVEVALLVRNDEDADNF